MKKTFLAIFLLLLIIGSYFIWKLFGPTISTPKSKYFYVRTGSDYSKVKSDLVEQGIIPNTFFFNLVAKNIKYDQHIKAGRFEIKGGSSLVNLVRMLNSGKQTPVRLVINKIRTKEDLAGKIGRQFETDSLTVLRFITNNDSLRSYHLDTNTVLTTIIPNTYLFWWNIPFNRLFNRLNEQSKLFWNPQRKAMADSLKLTTGEVYTLASIVEEETNKHGDKGLIASVYLNRLEKGMLLQADPTVRYALRDFTITRVLRGHLAYDDPYNTYQNNGLPPGPICTPSINTIDAVLEAPRTDYLFFVASPDFSGSSVFSNTYPEHLVHANNYRRALDSLIIAKKNIN